MRCSFIIIASVSVLGASAEPLSYNRDIRPILAENCFACHGPDKAAREAKLRLDLREVAIKKEAIVPGDAEESELVFLINTDDEDDIMPPLDSHKSLTAEEKKLLAKWIEQGADYEPHWAYTKPERPKVPAMGEEHPIDNFVLAGLKVGGQELSAEAERSVLARRLSFDLTGLPPHVTGVADPSADLEGLLASPHFGERMAIYWLDLARYADTAGYHSDKERDVTPYRDYVIKAFNENKPYDQFIVEQLAGDLMENPTTEQYVATTFNRVNQVSEEGGIQDKEYIAKYYAERVRTTSVAFLGATMGCAECHDHKFDPFTTKDFYAMEAFFADIYEKGAYNGDGRYNEGADIKKYPGFSLSKLGPTLNIPEPDAEKKLARIATARAALQARLNETPAGFDEELKQWTAKVRKNLEAAGPVDVTMLEDDELPLGGVQTEAKNVHSGKLARRQKSGELIQHIVDATSKPADIAAGDQLFAWVWLDPKDPPKQVMLQFNVDGQWGHRAWWGEDLIPYGKGSKKGDHYRVGNLPELGKWVRLEVDADRLALPVGKKMGSFAYTQFGGTVLWDSAGRQTNAAGAVLAGFPDGVRQVFKKGMKGALSEEDRKVASEHFRTIAPVFKSEHEQLAKLDGEEKAAKGSMRSTLVTLSATPREIRLLPRGDWTDRSGEVLQPAVPEFLAHIGAVEGEENSQRLNRMDLAKWITSTDNPLTARAFTNRVWALFFGSGLSRDLQDLGNQGQWPTHLALLDWLSVEFMESGWDVKHLVKLIVTSKAYRQSSNVSGSLLDEDPYNVLYARQNPRRLPAEFIRDNALAVSGLLNTKLGGGNARPYQPGGYYAQLNFPKRKYQQHNDENQYRRGLYMHWQRSFLHPMLVAFDAPAREECTASRANSNTPLQALNLLNDPSFVEAARVLAQDLVAGEAGIDSRLTMAFERLLGRSPTSGEVAVLTALYEKQLARYKASPDEAKMLLGVGLAPVPAELDVADLAATTTVARALLNLHETITRY
ncbi:MAG: PSD1 and planctomycete cytochrome C domain-containing protein [Akkermansiaceae bacterium]|nr:PSD1 and planctomycete cytochrome C domain-containing protein [Akkermansiaceae bacterium]